MFASSLHSARENLIEAQTNDRSDEVPIVRHSGLSLTRRGNNWN